MSNANISPPLELRLGQEDDGSRSATHADAKIVNAKIHGPKTVFTCHHRHARQSKCRVDFVTEAGIGREKLDGSALNHEGNCARGGESVMGVAHNLQARGNGGFVRAKHMKKKLWNALERRPVNGVHELTESSGGVTSAAATPR